MKKRCVILGPSKIKKIKNFGKIKNIENYIKEIANFLSRNFEEVLIIPDNTLALKIARVYKKINGKGSIIGYVPERSGGSKKIDEYFKYCDKIIKSEGGWFNLNTSLTKNSNYIFIFGFSAGVFIELCSVKYNQIYLNLDTHIYIDERAISVRLPKEVEVDLKNLFYFNNFKILEKKLRND